MADAVDVVAECCLGVEAWMLDVGVLATAGEVEEPLFAGADVGVGVVVVAVKDDDAVVAVVTVAVAGATARGVDDEGGDGRLPNAIWSGVAGPRHLGRRGCHQPPTPSSSIQS